MANDRPGDKKQQQKKEQQRLQQLVAGLGLGGAYTFVIEKAIQEGWTQTHFLHALVHSRPFHHAFPGLLIGGDIAPFLAGGRPSPFSVTSLGSAIANYYTMRNAYTQALR